MIMLLIEEHIVLLKQIHHWFTKRYFWVCNQTDGFAWSFIGEETYCSACRHYVFFMWLQ